MTKQSILKFSVLLLLTLISHEKLSANDFELFREIYRTESKKTAESLKHIKGRYQKISTGTDATLKQQSYIDKGEFAVSGDYGKIVIHFERSSKGKSLNSVYVHCKTPDYYYSLSRNQPESNYSLEDLSFSNASEKVPFIPYEVQFGHFIKSPYKFYQLDLIQILDTMAITDPVIQNMNQDGKPIIKLSWHAKANPALRYEFEIDQSAHYRIQRATHLAQEKRLYDIQIRYDAKDPQSIIPSKVVYKNDNRKYEYEFFDLKFEPTPEAEFLPTFFGLPEFENNSRRSGVYSIFFIFIIALALFMRLIMHRRSQRSVGMQ